VPLLLKEGAHPARFPQEEEGPCGQEESGSSSGNKAANSHVLVPASASIEEVNDNVGIALYAAERVCWMKDSGATHHISPTSLISRTTPHAKAVCALGTSPL
jgi:hypothetical protein